MSENEKSVLIKSTLILTIAIIFSKVLGFIYVSPFNAMVGNSGYILFEYAYKPYAIMLSLATMGLPLAVSKFVSKYNELGDYRLGRTMLKKGMILLTATGFVWFVILYIAAPTIAQSLVGNNDGTGNSIDEVVFVIRMISVALIIVPPMALLRGFFQGYQNMTPTGSSQIIEQLVRVIFILGGTIVVLYVFHGSIHVAVGFATFAAFIGAVAGMWILLKHWNKERPNMNQLLEHNRSVGNMSTWNIFKELVSYAIPFVAVGLAIPLYQGADTFMVNEALMSVQYSLGEAEVVNSVIALVQKVILIPVSLATAFGLTLVPTITKSYVSKNTELMHTQINKTFQVILFLTIPAIAGLMALSTEIYALMFGTSNLKLGGELMWWYAPVALFYSLFTITAAILQGMNKQNMAVLSLGIGFIVKILLNVPLIHHFESIGTVLSTNIGFGITIFINLWIIKKEVKYSYRSVCYQLGYVMGLTLIMVGAIYIVKWVDTDLVSFVKPLYVQYAIKALLGVSIGGFVFLVASIQTPLFRQVFGNKYLFLDKLKVLKGDS
ncbi:hypothetical protein CN918_27240 [Priestia megaterium]|nr:hypothetical protein CN918_27240 [Priestia megaterium]